jgi:ABC-type microcin C transport system duplicated ATPase subunit YejF
LPELLHLNPKYLFCDEPNSGLDPITAILIDALIKELTEEYSMTTIVNTHDMNSVMEIGEKIIFISDGVKCWEGNKNDILNSDCGTLNDFVFANSLAKKLRALGTNNHEILFLNLLVVDIFTYLPSKLFLRSTCILFHLLMLFRLMRSPFPIIYEKSDYQITNYTD